MDPSQIFEALTKEWDVISAVPWSFTIAIVFVATVEFLAVPRAFPDRGRSSEGNHGCIHGGGDDRAR